MSSNPPMEVFVSVSDEARALLQAALDAGQSALSEYEAKRLLSLAGVPVVEERLAHTPEAAAAAATELGMPVAVKGCGATVLHKSELGLVRLGLETADAVRAAAEEVLGVLARAEEEMRETRTVSSGVLVQRMARGRREVIAGGVRDAFFGPCVMLGVGGTAVEAMGDVSFRMAPVEERDALEMVAELKAGAIFDAFRGEPAVDRASLLDVLSAVGRLLLDFPEISQVDINPLVVEGGRPVAVDALVTLDPEAGAGAAADAPPTVDAARFLGLFEPESIAVVGASESPLKWGFRILFNTLEGGYTGTIYPVNPKRDTILGMRAYSSVTDLPEAPDLAMIVVPPPAVPQALRDCAARGTRAAIVITAGFAELGDAGATAAQEEIQAIARDTGLLIVGPNCAGVASPAPQKLYCGMISRFPEAGGLSIVSQSGNVGSTVLTWSQLHQVGVARFISAGNEACVQTEDYLDFYAEDEKSKAIIAYVEGTKSGRRLFASLRNTARQKPLILIKGGRSAAGNRAAQSHTGALAAEGRLFEAVCRQAGVTLVSDTYQAMEVAATLMRQPLPKGRRVALVSQGGGWGVIGADACTDAGLEVVDLPEETIAKLDSFLPKWWSRGNPIDLVGSTELSDIPNAIAAAAECPAVDAVILLGCGYISSAYNRYQDSARAQELGLDKLAAIGSEMEVNDVRTIVDLIPQCGKPILVASDTVLLARGNRDNAALAELERRGVYVFSSPTHVARAAAHLAERYEYLNEVPRRRGLFRG